MAFDDVLARLDDSAATTVLIDGRSGSGKSTLATCLGRRWAGSVIVHLDDIYPGWDGLFWAEDHVRSALLEPRAAGGEGSWRGWDWAGDRPAAWHTVRPGQRLIVEGVGALSQASTALADLSIWVDADDADRKARALHRDGETYRPYWDRWAAQENDFIVRNTPRRNADLIAAHDQGGFILTPTERTP